MAEYIERKKLIEHLKKDPLFDLVERYGITGVIESLPAANVRPVVTCGECKWWTKQEMSLQGRCDLMQMYPTGAWFCANGRRDDEKCL